MPVELSFAYSFDQMPDTVAMAAYEIAVFVGMAGIDPNNLAIIMGQHHREGPSEMAQVHFANALAKHLPFRHFCNELPDKNFAECEKAFVPQPYETIGNAAYRYAETVNMHKASVESIARAASHFTIGAFPIVNTLMQGRVNHFIDLERVEFGAQDSRLAQTPDMKYHERYKNKCGVLAQSFAAQGELFTRKGAHTVSLLGLMQRDVQMTGRIDDLLMSEEGPVVANVGLDHVHDCHGLQRPTLTDYLLCAGRDVITLSFRPSRNDEKTNRSFDAFKDRYKEVQQDYAANGDAARYRLHAFMKMTA